MGLTIVVVLVVLAVIAAAVLLSVQGRRRRQEQQRIEAAEHRHEAEIRTASAQRREAEAAEAAARAKQDREVAQARQTAADRVDPDGPADPAARTDDLRMRGAADHDRPPADQPEPERSGHPEPVEQPGGRGRHASSPQRQEQAPAADPAGSTDDVRVGQGSSGHEPTGAPHQQDGDPLSRAWHGPTASGGSVGSDRGSRHAEATGPDEAQADVPAQRTGEHERHGVRALADRLRGRHG